jgi:hypothetical protein
LFQEPHGSSPQFPCFLFKFAFQQSNQRDNSYSNWEFESSEGDVSEETLALKGIDCCGSKNLHYLLGPIGRSALHKNKISGTIPIEIGMLSEIETL